MGGQVVAEIDGSGTWTRGYVYIGRQMLAIQSGGVNWTHQDPIAKSQRVTDINGNAVSIVELDPFCGDTSRNSNAAFRPHRFTATD